MNYSSQSTKRILVTGGAGFLGSHLCDALIKQGHFVLCLDNLFTGSLNNIGHLLHKPNFKYIEHDICLPYFTDVDEVYHLACPASPIHYQFNSVKTIETNVVGTTNMLGLAKKAHAKFLLTSTSEVYGDPTIHPQTEDYRGNVNPIGPRACYDEGKRCAETLSFEYNRQHNVIIKVVRIFNTFGPRMHLQDGRVVSNFIVQALKGKPITIYGDGSQTRSYCYVDDLIQGILKMMNTTNDFTGPVNLGNNYEISVLELAKKIIKLTSSHSKIQYNPLPQDDPTRRRPDITLAKNKLKWEPQIDLERGLMQTIHYFETILNRNTTFEEINSK
jgi:UDP-glucuronate decarboxylase